MAYKDIVPIGNGLIIGATSFALGVIYANFPYDLQTLWLAHTSGDIFENSLNHYKTWGSAPVYVHYIFHFVLGLGFLGCFIKLYKPNEEAKYFEYGTLALYMVAVVVYLTNLRVGVASAVAGQWGDVDSGTGINVIAASQFLIVLVLIGVFILQGGLYYAEWYDNKLKEEFFKKEAEIASKAAVDAGKQQEEVVGESTGVETEAKETAPTKKTKRIIKKKV
ncbi:hypothetical protein DFJ63DRAFT_310343 [Scheffersomyces coipomensis]|uniref:uncharacterized protein n=1 Tax=Scheffersomyces coipomensis TaxID=1788519 RepID=UPI00315D2E55